MRIEISTMSEGVSCCPVTTNKMNQYTTRYRPHPVHVMGAAEADETVYVNGAQVAYRNNEYFWKEILANTMSAAWLKIEVATSGGVTNVGHIFLPSRPEYFTYDLDGNMVSGSRWNYTWDAENRLTSMTDKTTSTNVGPKRIVFEYDYQGRRIAKKVWNNTAGTGNPATYLKYLYDGWNLIAELNGNSGNALVRAYTWGLDASGSMQGAGGVGGLLMVNAGTNGVHFPAYDLNGNVMGLVNAANGNISAKYEYGPFGEVFCSVGDMAKVNPFQFSTKYTDNETDLVYYGYRYYSPALGRWMSRDPIEERGGLNLYGFVNNDPVNKWDKLGQLTPPSYYIVFPPEAPPLDEWKFDDSPSFNLPSAARPGICKMELCCRPIQGVPVPSLRNAHCIIRFTYPDGKITGCRGGPAIPQDKPHLGKKSDHCKGDCGKYGNIVAGCGDGHPNVNNHPALNDGIKTDLRHAFYNPQKCTTLAYSANACHYEERIKSDMEEITKKCYIYKSKGPNSNTAWYTALRNLGYDINPSAWQPGRKTNLSESDTCNKCN